MDDIDQDEELGKLIFLVIAGFIFLLSIYFSYQEMRFALWGRTVTARITQVREYRDLATARRWRPPKKMLAVTYTYSDEQGEARTERDDVNIRWPIDGDTVEIQYLPSVNGASRLLGHNHIWALWYFFGSLSVLIGAIIYLIREAKTPIRPSRARRRSQHADQ